MYPAVAGDPILAALLKGKARAALDGVGDASLGEWIETGRTAAHLRRRLSDAEVEAGAFKVVDLRGTPDAEARLEPVRRRLPPGWEEA
jgi:hypothetical protein